MKKLNAKQKEKVNTIKNYLNYDLQNDGNSLLIDCDQTNVYSVKNIYINASGLWITGGDILSKKVKENIYPSEINGIYRACMKDEDFKAWFELSKICI